MTQSSGSAWSARELHDLADAVAGLVATEHPVDLLEQLDAKFEDMSSQILDRSQSSRLVNYTILNGPA